MYNSFLMQFFNHSDDRLDCIQNFVFLEGTFAGPFVYRLHLCRECCVACLVQVACLNLHGIYYVRPLNLEGWLGFSVLTVSIYSSSLPVAHQNFGGLHPDDLIVG